MGYDNEHKVELYRVSVLYTICLTGWYMAYASFIHPSISESLKRQSSHTNTHTHTCGKLELVYIRYCGRTTHIMQPVLKRKTRSSNLTETGCTTNTRFSERKGTQNAHINADTRNRLETSFANVGRHQVQKIDNMRVN